jgi:hypothetical protein
MALNHAFLIDENFTQPHLASALKTIQGIDNSVRAYGYEVVGSFATKAVSNLLESSSYSEVPSEAL